MPNAPAGLSGPLEAFCPVLGAWFDCFWRAEAPCGAMVVELSEPAHAVAAGPSWLTGEAAATVPAKQLRVRSKPLEDCECGTVPRGTKLVCLRRRQSGEAHLWTDAVLERQTCFLHTPAGCPVRRCWCLSREEF